MTNILISGKVYLPKHDPVVLSVAYYWKCILFFLKTLRLVHSTYDASISTSTRKSDGASTGTGISTSMFVLASSPFLVLMLASYVLTSL